MGVNERPDWLVEGAEVYVIREGTERTLKADRIKKIVTKTFSLVANQNRFRIIDQRYRDSGVWGARYKVVPKNGDEVKTILDERRRQLKENIAWHACNKWMRARTEQNRVAAIEALQALDPELVNGE